MSPRNGYLPTLVPGGPRGPRRPNADGAPYGGWPDPYSPRPTDDPQTRHNRAAVAAFISERRRAGVPTEGFPDEHDDEEPTSARESA